MSDELSSVAVLFAQVADHAGSAWDDRSARLFEQDVAIMRSIAGRNEGRVVAVEEGRVQMVFGTSLNAVASALELQGLFAKSFLDPHERLTYRLGAHYGEAKIGPNGAEGEAVELAARIQESARVGGIWVSRVMADAVKGRVPALAVPRGNRTFKQLGKTVELYELVQGLGTVQRGPKRWRLSKAAPAWANSLAAKADGPSRRAREAIQVLGWRMRRSALPTGVSSAIRCVACSGRGDVSNRG